MKTEHEDDKAIDRFAAAMKEKMAISRSKGRSGWDDTSQCTDEHLAVLLTLHLCKGSKGTFEDIANFAMMLHQRKADPMVISAAMSSIIEAAKQETIK